MVGYGPSLPCPAQGLEHLLIVARRVSWSGALSLYIYIYEGSVSSSLVVGMKQCIKTVTAGDKPQSHPYLLGAFQLLVIVEQV